MRLGYNTNGFAHHRLEDTFEILAEIGYAGAALTLERDLLDPPDPGGVSRAVDRLRRILEHTRLAVSIETGSRFILDPRRKHQPTLISANPGGRRRRLEFLVAAVDIAAEIGAECVSLWSGAADQDADGQLLLERLTAGLRTLLTRCEPRGVRLAFEPEPGMFIDTMERFAQLHDRLCHPLFGLTLDVGHVHCLGDGDIGERVRRWRDRLWNVHIEDARHGAHEHLMFGEGDLNFAMVFEALRGISYPGPVHVELSRHSHNAVDVARRSLEFLRGFA